MARYEITAPDGTRWEVSAPDDATQDQVLAHAQQQWAAKPQQPAQAPGATRNNDLASQAGLALRSGVKGLAAIPALGADALGGLANKAQDLALGEGRGYRFHQTLPALDRLMTRAGLPEPDTALQRIVGKAVEVGTGSGAAAQLAGKAAQGATGVTQQVLQRLAERPAVQVSAGVGAGLAGQQAAENGAGWGGQFVASLLGGVAGGGMASGVQSLAESARRSLSARLTPAATIEARVTAALQNQGIDPRSINPAMRKALEQDVREAMKAGAEGLDEAALARLADMRRLGMTPTKGRVTLDPIDVTREQNAMRLAAATGARDARLPQIAQDNNQRLLSAMENLGPLNDRTAAGSAVIAPIRARDASMQAAERALYDRARSMAGGDIPLNPNPALNNIFKSLDDDLKTPFLPEGIAKVLNEIQAGTRPFDTRTVDVLKTMLATAQRGSADGNVRRALALVRDGLDSAPLQPAGTVTGATAALVDDATAAALRQRDQAPGQLMDALNEARRAAAQRRGWQESAPGITRALDDAINPDAFIKQNILSPSASARDAGRLRAAIGEAPDALQAVRGTIVQHLKDAAIGRGNQASTANFSGRQWSAALSNIGDAKLRLFFSIDELEQLKAIGRAGTVETFQPRGSAVNNSNTAAGVAGLLQGLSKFVKPAANKLPFGASAINAPLDQITLSLIERGTLRAPQGLLAGQPQQPRGLLDALVLPGTVGLLPAPPVSP